MPPRWISLKEPPSPMFTSHRTQLPFVHSTQTRSGGSCGYCAREPLIGLSRPFTRSRGSSSPVVQCVQLTSKRHMSPLSQSLCIQVSFVGVMHRAPFAGLVTARAHGASCGGPRAERSLPHQRDTGGDGRRWAVRYLVVPCSLPADCADAVSRSHDGGCGRLDVALS